MELSTRNLGLGRGRLMRGEEGRGLEELDGMGDVVKERGFV